MTEQKAETADGQAQVRTLEDFMHEPWNFIWFLVFVLGFFIFDMITLQAWRGRNKRRCDNA